MRVNAQRLSLLANAAMVPAGLAGMYLLHALLARQYGAEDYGLISVVLSTSSLVAIVGSFGLPAASQKHVATFSAQNNVNSATRYLMLGALFSLLGLALLTAVGVLASFVGAAQGVDRLLPLVVAVSLATMVWLWQRFFCLGLGKVTQALLPREIVFVVLMVSSLLLLPSDSPERILWIYAACLIVSCLPVLLWQAHKSLDWRPRPQLSRAESRTWLKSGRAFLLTTVLQLGVHNWDIVLLGVLSSLSETGQYAAASRLAMLMLIATRIINTLFGHRFAKLHTQSDQAKALQLFRRTQRYCLGSVVVMTALLVVLYKPLLLWLGNDYEGIVPVLVLLVIFNAIIVSTGPSAQYLNMTGREQLTARQLTIWSGISIVLNAALIPSLGGIGAAIAYGAANIPLRVLLFTHVTWGSK